MPLYWADYDADTAHFTAIQHGAYLMLIKSYWQSRKPPPDDDDKLWRIARCESKDQWLEIRDDIVALFRSKNGFLKHKRVEKEMREFKKKSDKKRAAGRKGGQVSANNRKSGKQRLSKKTAPPNHTDTDTDTDTEKKPADPPLKEYPKSWIDLLGDIEAEADMRMFGGAHMLHSWFELGCDYQIDILQPIKTVYERQKSQSNSVGWAYFKNIPPQTLRERQGIKQNNKAPDVPRENVSPAMWEQRVRKFIHCGEWSVKYWGPKPDDPGCEAPPEVLEKFKDKLREKAQ